MERFFILKFLNSLWFPSTTENSRKKLEFFVDFWQELDSTSTFRPKFTQFFNLETVTLDRIFAPKQTFDLPIIGLENFILENSHCNYSGPLRVFICAWFSAKQSSRREYEMEHSVANTQREEEDKKAL